MDFAFPAFVFLILVVSAWVGLAAQKRLHERYISAASTESIRLLMAMLVTFTALVLGLLTSSAKQRFDDYNNNLSTYGAGLVELDSRLRSYGPDADDIRKELRAYAAAAIADTWPREEPPSGQYPRFSHTPGPRNIEGAGLGDILAAVDLAIEHLTPADEFHRQIAERLRNRSGDVLQQRWRLIFTARSSVSWPFLCVLTGWLAVIFAIFGLTAPRNTVVYVVLTLSALSIASPLYLILDYSQARTGLLQLSSAPIRDALAHMDLP